MEKRKSRRKQMHYSPNLLSTINSCIELSRVMGIEYESRENGVTTRNIEPLAVVYNNRKRHLVAWCTLRQDYRSFRLDRINLVKMMSASFEPKTDYNLDDFTDNNQTNEIEGETIELEESV